MVTRAIGSPVSAQHETAPSKGKRRVPRYIYHMTSKQNYDSMVKDGFIKKSRDEAIGDGVFATELVNLFKRWRKNQAWGNSSLMESLIDQVRKDGKDVVILKIPTSILNIDHLKVRSQNRLFGTFTAAGEDEQFMEYVQSKMDAIPKEEQQKWAEKSLEIALDAMDEEISTHLSKGAPAQECQKYKQNKEAIEYIYQEDIDIKDTEKIGEVNIDEIKSQPEYNPKKPLWSFFTNLLKGTPEAKGAELLNC